MTAILNDSDAQLARAAAAGDMRAFAAIYGRYANRLHDFCVGVLADRDGAADCVQDVFCVAATRIPQLRDPDKLRPWLYSIARNEALRRVRDRRRETPSDELPDDVSGEPGPDVLAARLELADLIADAAGGLSDRDRTVLELAFRHGLSGADLADALGVTTTSANTIVHRLRETIERSLGALLVSRRVGNSGRCPELATILDGWDGNFNVLARKRISRHIESCGACDEERRRLVSPAALLGAAPVFIPAPTWLRERTLSQIQLTSSATSTSDGAERTGDAGAGHRTRRVLLPVALVLAVVFVAALIAAMGSRFLWSNLQGTTTEVGDVVLLPSVESLVPAMPVAPAQRATPVPPAAEEATSAAPSLVSEPPAPPPPLPAPSPPSAPPPTSFLPLPPLPTLPPLPMPRWPQWPQWPPPGGDPGTAGSA